MVTKLNPYDEKHQWNNICTVLSLEMYTGSPSPIFLCILYSIFSKYVYKSFTVDFSQT